MRILLLTFLFFEAVLFCSCTKKPSQADISKKILLEYICAENAKVDTLKIISEKETESFLGMPAIQFKVSGVVEWMNGCDETFGTLPPGYKQTFNNKLITLIKSDNGWQ